MIASALAMEASKPQPIPPSNFTRRRIQHEQEKVLHNNNNNSNKQFANSSGSSNHKQVTAKFTFFDYSMIPDKGGFVSGKQKQQQHQQREILTSGSGSNDN